MPWHYYKKIFTAIKIHNNEDSDYALSSISATHY